MFTPHKIHDAKAGWYIENYGACVWFHTGKYVLRIGKFWTHYKYAWRPLISYFKLFR